MKKQSFHVFEGLTYNMTCDQLKHKRIALGIEQGSELARLIDVDEETYDLWENGETPPPATLSFILDVFAKHPAFLEQALTARKRKDVESIMSMLRKHH